MDQKVKANIKYIAAIEIEMMKMVEGDEKIKANFKLVTSIKGIGKINGLMTIG